MHNSLLKAIIVISNKNVTCGQKFAKSWERQQQYALSKQVWLQPKRVECYLHHIEGSLHPIQSKLRVISNYCRKKEKVGKRKYSIQYNIQLQDRLHNLHYIHTTTFIPQYTQEKMVIKLNSSAIFEKIEVLFTLTNNEM